MNLPTCHCDSSKKRKLNTTKYLHKTRFEEGRASDVKIIALNREWNLHKIFLEKSPYFQSMFSGPWIETTQKEINIRIEDANVTSEALHKVFESLYIDEIQIEPSEVIPILACATLFQLDDLTDRCAEVMKDSINIDTAIPYWEASDRYSIEEVKNITLAWLYTFLGFIIIPFPKKVNLISHDLMRELVTSPELCILNEGAIFSIVIVWMFLKENPAFENYDSLLASAYNFFENLENEKSFLDTDSGILYQPVFRALRLQNLILYWEIEKIESLNVIPKDWFTPVFKTQWCRMIKICIGSDKGPKSKSVSEKEFNRDCIREFGKISTNQILTKAMYFDFGFGLTFEYENGFFYIKRSSVDVETEDDSDSSVDSDSSADSVDSASSNNNKRNIMYKVTLFSKDDNLRVYSKAETGLKTLSLATNEKAKVLTVTPPMEFPLYYKINFLLTTP